ncbi:hypothetical protein HYH03_010786 [Edaphochlamys debaryana]|uniref:Uncharacterized protein n=1 Tax=Edaphochlamys debaryana TaxID=47281 RepID=A0A835XXL0_9CHLO|nr:hypothetical protein HYH03_010786 [Edaphochlamys debaryana]|eukprot:KAG2490868.1 hypothetical protein HYH03_010786 [Edaphochlamys debaryana]
MDTLAASRDDGLRRALSLALPVGAQLGSVSLESLGKAAAGTLTVAGWTCATGLRVAGSSVGFVNRNVLAPLSSFAFGSSSASSSNVRFSTCAHSCAWLQPQKARKSRTEVRFQRASSGLRTGSAKCSIRRSAAVQEAVPAAAPVLLAHLAASSVPMTLSSELGHDEHLSSSGEADVAHWTVATLGLQSSML